MSEQNRVYRVLEGKTIKEVKIDLESDAGLILLFNDGTSLTFGYSGDEGSTEYFDGHETTELDVSH